VEVEVNGVRSLYNSDLLFVVQNLVSKSIPFNAAESLFTRPGILAALNTLASLGQSFGRKTLRAAVVA